MPTLDSTYAHAGEVRISVRYTGEAKRYVSVFVPSLSITA